MTGVTGTVNGLIDASTLSAWQDLVAQHDHFRIGTHVNPDGDALGSAIALGLLLKRKGKRVEVVCQHPAPDYLEFLPALELLSAEAPRDSAEVEIWVDLESPGRLGTAKDAFGGGGTLVVIDHHIPHESPGDLRIVDPKEPATASLLTELFVQCDWPIDADIATCLLTGILTDTGSFRFNNTTAAAMRQAAVLLDAGARLHEINENVYRMRRLASVLLTGRAVDHLQISSEDRIALTYLSKQDFEECAAVDSDTEGIVNFILDISTVEVSGLAKEQGEGVVKASLRSRGKVDVAQVAQKFGGGGHRNAAGMTLHLPLPDAIATLQKELSACLASC